ncbi:uncharacterized protein [Drosophila tropicalis]|uniref:uncharacterized protein n=1 Tax=Drosophila tropicalis TaxID=46794 RepID=UPI0035ABADD7
MERESYCSLSLGAMTPRKSLANPMADSTRIDGGLTTTLTPKLNQLYSLRGNDRDDSGVRGRSISQNPRSNSYSNLSIGSPTKSTYDLNRSASSSIMNRSKLNLSQLDPRTYANVNSTGLASRIAKYQESAGGAGRLQRSISVNNLPMPLARPRRSIVSSTAYSPSAPKLSATRIAPPERSFYSGNTLSSLLRSNSVVGIVHKAGDQQHQGQEQLSRENRPILHPPPTQQEIEPTRSVLEELKEISRKRINSGEPHEPPHEFAKKRMAEFVDPHSHALQSPGQSPHQMAASFKRQREQPLPLTVAVPLRQPHNMPPSPVAIHQQHMQSNGGSGGGSISKLGTPTQLSPEQQAAKRRNCSYSNDITSSLSSSRRQSHKRKLYDMRVNQRQSITGHKLSPIGASCNSSTETSPSQQASKIQRKVEMESVCKTLSMPTPISTAVAVPVARMQSAPTETDGMRHATPPVAQASKPKLTLFNAQQKNQSNQEQSSSDLNSPEVDASEYAGIQFVKPKQQNSKSIGIGKNPSIERMQKTKLAIMLSGLRGEMYIGEPEDDTDAPLSASSKLISPIKPIIASTTTVTATTMTTATTTTAATATKTSVSILTKPNVEFKLQPSNSSSSGTTPQVKPSIMFGNEIKTLKPPAAATGAAVSTTSTTTAATSTTPFTFGDAIKGAATNMTQAKNDSASVISKPETKNVASVNPILSFGAPKATSSSAVAGIANLVPSSSTAPAMPQIGAGGGSVTTTPMFSFGNKTTATTTSTITNLTTTATTNTAFSFGSGTSASASTAATAAAPPPAAAATTTAAPTPTATTFGQLNKANSSSPGFGGFSFGGNNAAPTTTPSLGAFGSQPNSFLNNSKQPGANPPTSSTATATPAFGSQTSTSSNSSANAFKSASEANPNPASQETAKAFSFGSTTNKPAAALVQPSTTASTTNAFSFGASNNATTTTNKPAEQAPNTSNIFGQNLFGQKPEEAAATTTASTPFAFGGGAKPVVPTAAATAAASTPFTFGGASKPAAPEASASAPFTFGGLKPAAAPAASTDTEKSTPFAFGGAKPAASGNNLFSFNGAAAAGQAPTATTITGGGAAASPSTNSAFSFSANAVQKPAAPIFGSQKPATTATATPFSFGGAPAVEQQQQPQQSNPQAAAPSTSGFSFGAAINKTNSDTNAASNIFGTPTGVVKPSFAFGDNNASTTSTTPAPAPAQSSGFGGFGAAAAPGGANNQQSKPFSFGGSSSASVAPSAASIGGNLFANAVAAAQFGAASNLPSTAPSNGATAKPFNFGGAQTASNNVFSPSTQTSATAPKPAAAAFQFGGAAPASPAGMPATAQQINANNMFAPPTEGRPIRRATRRLQK